MYVDFGAWILATDFYFLHEGSNSKLPAHTVIHYDHSEGLFRYPGWSVTCIEDQIGADGLKLKVRQPLIPGGYIAQENFVYPKYDLSQNPVFVIFNLPIKLYGVLRINNKIYKNPELMIYYTTECKLYINKRPIASTSKEVFFEIAADESSFSKSRNIAEALQEVYPTVFPPESPAGILVAWVSSGVVLAVVAVCLLLWSVVRKSPSKDKTNGDVDPPNSGMDSKD